MKTLAVASLAASFALAPVSALAAPQPTYSFTTIDYPGAAQTYIYAVNDADDYVGQYVETSTLATAPNHAILFEGGKLSPLNDAKNVIGGSLFSGAFSLNNTGLVAGYFQETATSVPHGFLYRRCDRTLTQIDYPGATSTQAFAVNDRGFVAGIYADAAGAPHGFFRDPNGTYRTTDIPDTAATAGNITYPLSINDDNLIVGELAPTATFTPVLGYVTHGADTSAKEVRYYNDPAAPTAESTYLISVNNTDRALGAWVGTDGSLNNFLIDAGSLAHPVPFTTPFGPTAQGQTLNDWGVIVGIYSDANGSHGFLARPSH